MPYVEFYTATLAGSAALNLTYPTALVLQALALGHSYGFEIMEATGLPSGTVYPILRRLERGGCARAGWEKDSTAAREGRPPRRHYALTAEGRALLRRARGRFARVELALASQRGLPSNA